MPYLKLLVHIKLNREEIKNRNNNFSDKLKLFIKLSFLWNNKAAIDKSRNTIQDDKGAKNATGKITAIINKSVLFINLFSSMLIF